MQDETVAPHAGITGLVLAGGAGRRVGHRDKGLLRWGDSTLIAQVVQRLAPQVGPLLISCNRNLDIYSRYASAVCTDRRPEFQGPLAGLEAAAPMLTTDYVAVVPCDLPLLPADLVRRLLAPLAGSAPDIDLSVAWDGERMQFLCALLRRTALGSLGPYLDAGGRSVQGWYARLQCAQVDFSDQRDAFRNVNSLSAGDLTD